MSRRIPISTATANATTSSSSNRTSSSLDLVYSYSRSIQANRLITTVNPSFVDQHYRNITSEEEEEDNDADNSRDTTEENEDDDDEDDADEDEEERLPSNQRVQSPSAVSDFSSGPFPSPMSDLSFPSMPRNLSSTERTSLLPIRAKPKSIKSNLHPRIPSRRLSGLSLSASEWQESIQEGKGKSTNAQTIFNLINVLVGIGLLSTPLAFAEGGWALGTIILLFCAFLTNYTAKVLAKMMSRNSALRTYSDVIVRAFPRGRTIIYCSFALELTTLSIALIVLSADSLEILLPSISATTLKYLALVIILPSTYLPLRFLSISSLLGIISSITLIGILLVDGITKSASPGSIFDPMPTSFLPNWTSLPLSIGLFFAGFAGHAIIPSIYRDMENPGDFNYCVNWAYIITVIVSVACGAGGYLMFGNEVSDEITREMLLTPGFSLPLNKIALWMVGINPLLKFALATSPLVATIEHLLGISAPPPSNDYLEEASFSSSSSSLDPHTLPISSSSSPESSFNRERFSKLARAFTRPVLISSVVALAIIIPDFSRVMAILGSFSGILICVVGPLAAYLVLDLERDDLPTSSRGPRRRRRNSDSGGGGGEKLTRTERGLIWTLLVISIFMCAIGTFYSLHG